MTCSGSCRKNAPGNWRCGWPRARTIRRLAADPGDYAAIAAAAREQHRAGTLTLVVLNTVEAGPACHKASARAGRSELHAAAFPVPRRRARAADGRDHWARPEDRIVVATQVVEAGIDLNASVLITEAAPWPSLVQRAGRCNRTGSVPDAELWWVPPAKPHPYAQADIDAAECRAGAVSKAAPSPARICWPGMSRSPRTQVAVLRRSDLIGLFDTAPDLSGADIDIAPYVRDADDLDAQLAWATWTPEAGDVRAAGAKAPPAEAKAPSAEWRCRVPLGELSTFLKRDGSNVWRLDQVLGRWTRVTAQARARPGEVLLVDAADGGYDPEAGFDPAARGPVPDCPALDTRCGPGDGSRGRLPGRLGERASSTTGYRWTSTAKMCATRPRRCCPCWGLIFPDDAARTAVTAAYLHDVGKAHETWQDALCRLAPAEARTGVDAGRPWAKSGGTGRLRFDGGVAFRHELASLLMLDGPLRGLLADVARSRPGAVPGARPSRQAARPGPRPGRSRGPGFRRGVRAEVARAGAGLDRGRPAAARPASDRADRGPGAVQPRRGALMDPHRARRCGTGTGRSSSPTWRPSCGSRTGAPAPDWRQADERDDTSTPRSHGTSCPASGQSRWRATWPAWA